MENRVILGIDEAGRGPLAGRVYAAGVVLDSSSPLEELNDSKKLTEAKREKLYPLIKERAAAYAIAYATEEEIDRLNILEATFLAMRRVMEQLQGSFNYIQIDGNIFPFKNEQAGEAIVKGDSLVKEIMAASILAKVERDHYMKEMDILYPEYGFSGHKGYPTKAHKEIISRLGPSPIHRKSFKGVKEYIESRSL